MRGGKTILKVDNFIMGGAPKGEPLTDETIHKAVRDFLNDGPAKIEVVAKYGPIENWNVSQVKNMDDLFNMTKIDYYSKGKEFDLPLNKWDTSNVTTMARMFYRAEKFNQPLNKWNTSKVTNMSGMFEETKRFNQPLTKWDTSKVTNMSSMFAKAFDFNKPLKWDTSNVTDMNHMFYDAYSFSQGLNTGKLTDSKDAWDVSNVTNMDSMFHGASGFSKPLNKWNVKNVETKNSFYPEKYNKKHGPQWVGKIQDKTIRYDLSTSLYQLREKYPTLESEHLAKILTEYAEKIKSGEKTFLK